MAEEVLDEWTVKASNILNISLVTKAEQGRPKTIASFRPTWTYPIVNNDEETIYGYKGLKISLRFNASDMRPHISHTSTKRVPATVAIAESPEIRDLFEPFLPPVAFGKAADFEVAVQNSSDEWHPPGELVETFQGDTEDLYEVWRGNLADPLVLALVKRIQILVSLFIEAGTPIQTESTEDAEADFLDRWTVFFLYQKQPRANEPGKYTYVFVGYSTVYRFFIFRPQTPDGGATGDLELPTKTTPFSDFPCRSRISQFVILPPFQHKGNGQRLYRPIFKTLLDDPNTFEITVEDPSEAFDTLRDMADLAFLREKSDFNEIRINTSVTLSKNGFVLSNIVDKKVLETVRTKYKIASRQFSRLVEMHLMSKLPDSVLTKLEDAVQGKVKKAATKAEEHEYRLWKLVTKSRIAAQNKEQLSALNLDERVTKLNETLNSVELEYALLLSMFEQRKDAHSKTDGKKRKAEEEAEASSSKKSKA
ncbi:acyl-CoA N-acyltransferase [Cryphonectria parasitica EP155]|uniref:Histone acetyltransferase type B catalytic subunit n=1 Tax=Cryphonectria parasitica (strain ATCC 38755 / EP155) TaxID=660469 RepID=A0A9P4YBL4_CRYP1|nr:acyl-CoA N-acyltransferase [Cryphonectria parasitica EP155]KAF3770353.1 acyl-CoA N-acyltransferase [Cryphonectria parasitica EP155]